MFTTVKKWCFLKLFLKNDKRYYDRKDGRRGESVKSVSLVGKRMIEENKRIKLRINRSNEYICMLVSNLYNGEIKKGNSGYYSRKREFKDTGIGLSSVSAVVEKYDGRMEVDHTNGEFNVFIMMANISSNLT